MNDEEYLEHFGILGMKWGKRKAKNDLYRKKISNLVNNKSLEETDDYKRFKYRNQHVASRIAKTSVGAITSMLVKDILTGKLNTYNYSNKKELTKRITSLALSVTRSVVLKDTLAKSASKRYSDSGKRLKGKKDPLISKETLIETGVNTAIRITPLVSSLMKMKAARYRINKNKNEEIFNRWGANILPQKVETIIWQSKDLKTVVIDK
jgi:hypothetical protein